MTMDPLFVFLAEHEAGVENLVKALEHSQKLGIPSGILEVDGEVGRELDEAVETATDDHVHQLRRRERLT